MFILLIMTSLHSGATDRYYSSLSTKKAAGNGIKNEVFKPKRAKNRVSGSGTAFLIPNELRKCRNRNNEGGFVLK